MTTAHEARLSMLANDGWQLREQLLPDGSPDGTGLLPMAIAPFVAQYLVEVYDLLHRRRAFDRDPFDGLSILLPRGHTMKALTWDGTGVIVIHKKLDAGKFELPKGTRAGDQRRRLADRTSSSFGAREK